MKLYEAHKWFRDHRMPVRIIICKARRAGLSTGVEALIFDDAMSTPRTDSLIVSHQMNPSENVLGMCKTFWEHMPKAIKFPTPDGDYTYQVRPPLHSKYQGNLPSDKLEFAPPLSSRIFIASAKSVEAYRSFAFQNIHATEVAHYDNANDLFAALTATVPDDPNTAIYYESTPNGMGGKGEWFYEQCVSAELRERNPEYGESMLVFIPWHQMPLSFSKTFDSMENRAPFERSLNSYEKDLIKQYDVSLEQLNWRRIKLASYNKDEEKFLQEYATDLVTCFLTSGSLVFSRAALQKVMLNTRRPEWVGDVYWGESEEKNRFDSPYNLVRRPSFLSPGKAQSEGRAPHTTARTYDNLKVWRWPRTGDRVIIGADIGRGNPQSEDGDYSTICVLVVNELEKDELIMTWRGRINVIDFGDVCAALAWGIRYNVGDDTVAPKLAPEWTGPGTATCTYIDERKLYPLWNYRVPGIAGFPASKHVGWESNAKTKPFAVAAMVKAVESELVDIPSKELALEMASYKQHGAMADDASFGSVGTHDDLVSSFQIAYAISRFEAALQPGENEDVGVVDLNAPRGDIDGNTFSEPFDEFDGAAYGPQVQGESGYRDEPFDEMGGWD